MKSDPPVACFDVSVLCVANEPATLEYLLQVLSPRVREMHCARDGRVGFLEFSRRRPDVVLTEMEMPKMDGLEMGEAIRSLSPGTPLVLISGSSDPGLLKRGIRLKAEGLLSMPVADEALFDIVRRCCETIRSQRAALAQHSLHELILNSLPFPLVLLNTATRKILFANPMAMEQGLFPHTQAIGPFFTGLVREDSQESLTLAEQLYSSANPQRIQAAGRSWEATINAVGPDISIYVAVDITAREHLESLKADVERLTRHDLKGPLGAVIGLPDILLNQPGIPKDIVEGLTLIREAGLTMLNQINLSLDLFKMEQGSYILEPEPLDAVSLIQEILPHIEPSIRAMRLTVEMTSDKQPVPLKGRFFIHGEKMLCLSMLSNLLKNAVEASPKGGQVAVDLMAIPEGTQIAIHNQGPVPAAIRNRIFEKYVTLGKRFGTGLGAYSAALIVKTHGGTIAMHSSDDTGTTVTIVLPRPPAIRSSGGSNPIGRESKRSTLKHGAPGGSRILRPH